MNRLASAIIAIAIMAKLSFIASIYSRCNVMLRETVKKDHAKLPTKKRVWLKSFDEIDPDSRVIYRHMHKNIISYDPLVIEVVQ